MRNLVEFELKINSDNDAFASEICDPNLALATILRDVAERIEYAGDYNDAPVYDGNGNKCGTLLFEVNRDD